MSEITRTPHMVVSVVIGTFGDRAWKMLGRSLLEETRDRQSETFHLDQFEVIHVHADTLAEARNIGAQHAHGDWLVFLDADDRLQRQYCMTIDRNSRQNFDIMKPSTWGFNDQGYIEPSPVWSGVPKHSLLKQNYLIIGAPVRRSIWESVGGFDEWDVLEDWAFWIKCEQAGAKIGEVRDLIYEINDDHTRNKHPDIDKIAREIRQKYQ